MVPAPRPVRNSSERTLIAHIRTFPGPEGQAAGLLTLVDLDECPAPNLPTLQAVFGLTKAEAKLALRLMCGDTIENIAEEHGVSISTARVQLKSIFAKTGTSRQAELVVVLTRLATLA
jgi:DNA-binding CsgD family transcriptional regulator